MKDNAKEPYPYNLPIYRRSYRSESPNNEHWAEIERANEVGMSDPTKGTLVISNGIKINDCNPSFVWSLDSKYLIVPEFFSRFGVFRRQRLLLIDVASRKIFLLPSIGHYFQPEFFNNGFVVVSEPLNSTPRAHAWKIKEVLRTCPVVVRAA